MKLYADYAHASISMIKDAEFVEQLQKVISDKNICYFLETGTNTGQGSTKMISEAILKTGVEVKKFYTLERDPFFFNKAQENLKGYPFVTQVLGLSTGEQEAIDFLNKDEHLADHSKYPDVFIDNIEDPRSFYINEIRGNLSGMNEKKDKGQFAWLTQIFKSEPKPNDNHLRKLLANIVDNKPLILLDSAGGIGYLEFLITMEVMQNNPFTIILDDTHHIKHWRSRRDIIENPRFKVLYDSTQHGRIIATSDV